MNTATMNTKAMRNLSARWRENRVREEIYKQAFKEMGTSSNGTEHRSFSSSKDRILGPINEPRTEGKSIDFPG